MLNILSATLNNGKKTHIQYCRDVSLVDTSLQYFCAVHHKYSIKMKELKTYTSYAGYSEIKVNVPTFTVPSNFETSNEYLKHLVFEEIPLRYGQLLDETIIARVNKELKTIEEVGLSDYFLIVADCVKYARKHGAMIDADISLSSSSIVVYCLGITSIDPIKYGLLFERFFDILNPKILPDIIMNIDSLHKEIVLKYVSDKYGDSNLLQQFKWSDRNIRLFSVIYCTVLNIKKTFGFELDIYSIPLDDNETLKSLFTENVKTQTFNMLLLANTIMEPIYPESIRALALQGERQNYHNIHQVSEYLSETHGFVLFQEQVMWLSQLLAGFTPEESNELRKDLDKRHYNNLQLFMSKFMDQTTKRGYEETAMRNLWDKFNSYHRLSKTIMLGDALLEYRAAYLKVHYTAEYEIGESCTKAI